MPKLVLVLIAAVTLVVSSLAGHDPLKDYFSEVSLKSLGPSDFDAVKVAVKAMPEHPILAQYSYIYELGSYLYLRGPPLYAEADSLDYYDFMNGHYAQLSPDARKQVDDVLPKVVKGIKLFGEEGGPEIAYTFEAIAFIAIRYDNSFLEDEDYKFVALGLLKRYEKLTAEDKKALKQKVPDLVKFLEEIRKYPSP